MFQERKIIVNNCVINNDLFVNFFFVHLPQASRQIIVNPVPITIDGRVKGVAEDPLFTDLDDPHFQQLFNLLIRISQIFVYTD
jgi:hypothetical protein